MALSHTTEPIKGSLFKGAYRGNSAMAKKQSTPKVSTLASKVLSGDKKPTIAESKKLAASVLSQDEKKGQKR